MTCYRSIKNPDKLAAYAKLARAGDRAVRRQISRARRRRPPPSKPGLKQRIVITEFPSVEQAIAAHDSPAYQAAVKVLGDGAERDVRIVEGAGIAPAYFCVAI